MRICQITTTLPPVVGGLETQVWELSRRLVRAGHSVTLIGSRNYQGRIFPEYEEVEGVAVHRVRENVLPVYYFRYRLFALRAALLARRLGGRKAFDLVHAHQVYPAGVAGGLLQARYGLPLVITCHGSALAANWEIPWIKPLMRWALGRAASLIAVGSELRQGLLQRGVSADRVEVIPNCVDTEIFSPSGAASGVRGRFGWKEEATVIAFVGRLHPVKGPGYFLRMALSLLKTNPDLKFLLVGGGELEAALREEAARSGRAGAIAFTGPIDHSEVPGCLKAADILVVPSLFEGGGLTALEGMGMGKAVVAGRVGGLTESIRDGRTGILVDPLSGGGYNGALARAVAELAADSVGRRKLGEEAGRMIRENYSWETGLARHLKIYEQAVGAI